MEEAITKSQENDSQTDTVFSILGVNTREDVYTNLISFLFNKHAEFRMNFLKKLEGKGEDYKVWQAIPWPRIGAKDDIPDLLLLNKATSEIILIENKIYAEEGETQTKRYASPTYKKKLQSHYDRQISKISYYYLTLEGQKPSSSEFKPLSYSLFLDILPKNITYGPALAILLNDFHKNIKSYYSLQGPNFRDKVLTYLKKDNFGFVKPQIKFKILLEFVSKNLRSQGFKTYYGIINGVTPFCQFYKDIWVGKEIPAKESYYVHFEFQWYGVENMQKSDKERPFKLYLHYETNPYKTKKELKQMDNIFNNEIYTTTRTKFFDHVKSEYHKNEWKIKKGSNLIASYNNFSADISVQDLERKLTTLITELEKTVDEYFKQNS